MTITHTLEPTVVRMPDPAVREHPAAGANGFLGLDVGVAAVVVAIWAGIGLAGGPGAAACWSRVPGSRSGSLRSAG